MVVHLYVEWQTLFRDSPPSAFCSHPLSLLSHQQGTDIFGRYQLCDDIHGHPAHSKRLLFLHLRIPHLPGNHRTEEERLHPFLCHALFLRYGDGFHAGTRPLLLVAPHADHDAVSGGYGDEGKTPTVCLDHRHPQFPNRRSHPQQYCQDLSGCLVCQWEESLRP